MSLEEKNDQFRAIMNCVNSHDSVTFSRPSSEITTNLRQTSVELKPVGEYNYQV